MKKIIEKMNNLLAVMSACNTEFMPTGLSKENAEKIFSACKKQVPKKPLLTAIVGYICPECDYEIDSGGGEYNYCPHCGQALDWSDEDE